MSVKRQATTELNHDNWDQEDPADHEDMGIFKAAPKEEIEKRVIRTAKRRSQAGSDTKKAVFSSFGGFNKAAPSSFDFLANLTNGSKANENGSPKSENTVTSGLFSNPIASSTFQMPVSSPSPITSTRFGASTQPSSSFVGSANTLFSANKADASTLKNPTSSTITASPTGFTFKGSTTSPKTTTPQVSPSLFEMQPTSTAKSLFQSSNSNDNKEQKSTATTNLSAFGTNTFGAQSKDNKSEKKPDDVNDDPNKLKYYSKLKDLNESVLDWIKKHVNETPLCILTPIFNDYEKHLKLIQDDYEKNKQAKKSDNTFGKSNDASSSVFSAGSSATNAGSLFTGFKPNAAPESELKSLPAFSSGKSLSTTSTPSLGTPNSSGFTFGINKASEKTSPFAAKNSESTSPFAAKAAETILPFGAKAAEPASPFGLKAPETTSPFGSKAPETTSPFGSKTAETNSPFGSKMVDTNSPFGSKTADTISPFGSKMADTNSPFGAKTDTNSPFGAKTDTNSPFGAKTDTNSPFGAKTDTNSPFAAKTSPFGAKTSGSSAAPFSFGTGQPFSFSSNTQNPVKTAETENKDDGDNDEPPKVEFTPIVEENSVFEKKCKIFFKKGDSYADKGLGTLYIKKLESGKHQLLVRANTSLGNVILNFILSPSVPTQRMGKNNVMVVCVPTPDVAPPPVPALIRVKTAEEADELLQVLNKHKV